MAETAIHGEMGEGFHKTGAGYELFQLIFSSVHFFVCMFYGLKILTKMVVVSDLINTPKPDERAIMTYVSCYYHAFQGAQQVQGCILMLTV